MLASSQKMILLCLRTCSFIPCTFSLFYLAMHAMAFSMFGIHHTVSKFGKPLKNLWSSHCLHSKSYFQHFKSFSSIFPQFKAKFYADMLFFPVCQILDTPTCNEQDSTQQSHMLQPSSMQEMLQHMLLFLHLAAEVHASNSSVISQSVWKLWLHHVVLYNDLEHQWTCYSRGLTDQFLLIFKRPNWFRILSFYYSEIIYVVSATQKYPSYCQHLTVIALLYCKKGTTQKI